MFEMVFDERRDEIVPVVISRMDTQVELQPAFVAGLLQSFGLQLLLQEWVIGALVDQYLVESRHIAAVTRNLTGVVIVPAGDVAAKIVPQRLFTPGTVQRRAYGCKSGQ